jgi:hypothetical protein
MIGQIATKVMVNTNLETAPDPEDLVTSLQEALRSVEEKYQGAVKFGEIQFVNLVTGLEIRRDFNVADPP